MSEFEAKLGSLKGHAAALRNAALDAASRLEVDPTEILWVRGAEISLPVKRQCHPPPALFFPFATMAYSLGEGEDSKGIQRTFGDVLAKVKRPAPCGYQARQGEPVLPYEISSLSYNSRRIRVETQTVAPSDKKLALLDIVEYPPGKLRSTHREVFELDIVDETLRLLKGQQYTDPQGEVTTRTKWVDVSKLHKEPLERVVDKMEGTTEEVIWVLRGLYWQHPGLKIERRSLR